MRISGGVISVLLEIIEERSCDRVGIAKLTDNAFGSEAESRLITELRARDAVSLSLVAIEEEELVGHILFSPVRVEGLEEGEGLTTHGLGPMSVRPDRQRRGIGSSLARKGLEYGRRAGWQVVVVLGHPEYYPRFGFVPASDAGLRCEWEVPRDAFMVLELTTGALEGIGGLVRYHPAFAGV